jgi:hypothetical protein
MKQIISFLILVAAASCIDPYTLNLKNYKSLLVVEGLITNENSSYKIKLYRTTSQENSVPEKVTDANLYIADNAGVQTHLKNCGDGSYMTDSATFTGVIGNVYTLQILTSDGKEYKSEPCTMIPVAGIASVYYEKGEELSGSQAGTLSGIKVFLNTGDASGMNLYFRWEFEEVWKFISPSPPRYIYIDDSTILPINVVNDLCFKRNASEEILTNSILPGGENTISKEQIQFIPPVISDRLTYEYSIEIKQYSVSKKEFDFWNNLKKVNESGGDIFDSQPYPVISNIRNVNDAGEMVLGYFEVSAIEKKRIFITARELDPLFLPHYTYDCTEVERSQDDYISPGTLGHTPSWDEIYQMFMSAGDFVFIEPRYNPVTGALIKLVFARKICSDCGLTGTVKKPDFWIDLE